MAISPPEPVDDRRAAQEEAYRLSLSFLLWVCGLTWLAFALQYVFQGRWKAAALDLTIAVVVLGSRGVLPRIEGLPKARRLFHLNLAFQALGVCAVALMSGLTASLAIWYLILAPLVAAYQEGVRSSVAWAFAAMTAMAALHGLEAWLPLSPQFVPKGMELLFGQWMLLIVLLLFGIAARRGSERQLEALREREDIILEQSQRAEEQAQALSEARDLALGASNAKSDFLAHMSHEMRTPLNGLLGMSDLLVQMDLQDKPRQIAETIRKSSHMLLALLNDVLDFSKIEAGHLLLEDEPFALEPCVADVISLFAAAAKEKGLRLHSQLDAAAPKLLCGDVTRLRQILLNLVSNAIKFTHEGEVIVSVGVGPPAQEGGPEELVFCVRDTGIGVPPERADALFAAFVQQDASTTRQYGGTGLGLSISKNLVELMEGRIWVDSQPGEGSSFYFALPLRPTSDQLLTPEVSTPSPIWDSDFASQHPLQILIVEDNRINQQVFCEMLRRLGYEADVAATGREAISMLQMIRYDLLLMDIQMPELDGPDTTRYIRKHFAPRHQPRITALTANVMPHQKRQCREAGMEDFLAKPLEFPALISALKRASASRWEVSMESFHPSPPEDLPQSPAEAMDKLWSLTGQRFEAFRSLLTGHIRNNAKLLTSIQAAFERSDAEALQLALHSLKSTSAMFGSFELSETCAEIERGLEASGLESLSEAPEEIERHLIRIKRRLDAELDRREQLRQVEPT